MSESTVAIVGSGIAATAIAYHLTSRGYEVVIFEKGPEYPYPHSLQFGERIRYRYHNPAWDLPPDLKYLTLSGDYQWDLNGHERGMVVGGSATHWTAITPRMNSSDFETQSQYGYGQDWPLKYPDLEPYYCRAEAFMGVSGTDADNPFAPPRSKPFPLPPFALSYDDRTLAERLRRNGIVLHTTPQARTRQPYDGRPGCQNFGTCNVCPIGARYSPNHHLARAQATGRCRIVPNSSVRRVILDAAGRAQALVYRSNTESDDKEHAAKVIVIAAGGIETPRLLLLSTDNGHPDGLGNQSGHVGRHLTFHHIWYGAIQYKEPLYPGRIGPMTGHTRQFCDPPNRGKYGGILVEFSSSETVASWFFSPERSHKLYNSGAEILEEMASIPYQRLVGLHAESVPSEDKYVTLSRERDRFGDPFAHVRYVSNVFDGETYQFARQLFGQFVEATDGQPLRSSKIHQYDSGAHHMGACRMGHDARDSVVDNLGRVHGVPNLFLAGSAIFAGASGAVQPTLTLVALALRSAEYIERELS